MNVVLQNEGEGYAEINWGEMHLVLKPGERTFPMPEALARKLTFRNANLKAIPVESLQADQKTEAQSETEPPQVDPGPPEPTDSGAPAPEPEQAPVQASGLGSEADFDLNKVPPENLNKNINRVGAGRRKDS